MFQTTIRRATGQSYLLAFITVFDKTKQKIKQNKDEKFRNEVYNK